MSSKRVYTLSKGVQVRKEIFGLLFYDYRGPRLYFVPSKDLLPDSFFDGGVSIKELTDALPCSSTRPGNPIADQIILVLEMLERKGLIHGQSIC
ncbi:MAG: mycofactocin biosynthesis chaperone MftB [Desulfobacteraceae bacterium]|nr:mycofactocin biosynthesis chaperone MftB [Desulfobacteraceae bacterium]